MNDIFYTESYVVQYNIQNQRTRLPYIAVENISLRLFWNFNVFCSLSIHMNNIKIKYDRLESVKFGFSMFDIFSQFLSNLFTFLINNR